ncbi:ankyrin repeat domain-containing protein, partial [Mycena galericulata]
METPHQSHLTIQGGRGGNGGQGGQQGGGGGVGYGPNVNAGTGTMHVHYHKEAENRDIILNWLSPINFFLRQADILQVREKGTGEWLLADPLFKQWESGSGRTLWCHGIPGAGKTVLVSMVVGHLGTQFTGKNIGVACIYLNHKEVENQIPSRLLAGLWRQLVLHRDIGSIAENLYKQHREKGTAPSLEEVVNVLSSCLKEFSQVFIIVDAIDECPEFQREILLKQLEAIGSNVNLMITSRPNISPEPSSFPNLEILDIQAAPEDIQKYINTQIKLSPRLLHIESLSEEATIKAVQEALKHLPKGLNTTYDSAMKRIEDQGDKNKQIAYSTLTWVVNAKRPLTVSEIQTALAVEPDSQELDDDNVMDIQTILSVCAGLVIMDKESSLVRLVHYTTQEYLDSIQARLFPDAQTEIARTLLTVLAFDGYPDSSWKLGDLPPLVKYSQYCLAHAVGQPEVQLRETLLRFLCCAFQWIEAMNHGVSWEYTWDFPPWNYGSSLHIAAAGGHIEIVRILLEKGANINAAGGREGSSLHIAAARGHTEIVRILLEKGANVNAAGGRDGSSLHIAAARGHIENVRILLEKGANVNAAEGGDGSSLQAAAARGHTEIVGILLEKGANVNSAQGLYGSSLQVAAAGGHTEIVGILLEKGANVNATGGEDRSSLQAAAARGHTEIVRILLEKGADVNAAGGRYGSSLHIAAARGHTEIVRYLLEKGADINAAQGRDGSLLHIAAARGHTEIVRILLEKGANINAPREEPGNSLQAAAAGGHTDIVRILLEKGANINSAGGSDGNSLQAAAAGGHTEIVGILLEKGADVNAAGGEYGSSLQAAAARGHTEIVRILLEKGANINSAGGRDVSSLQAAAAGGHTEIVRILLEKGA